MRIPTLLLFSAALLYCSSRTAFASDGVPTFQDGLKPLIDAKCIRCHGDKVHKADLDLRTLDAIMKGGESGAIVIPGKPDKSLLFEKVHKGEMPPSKKDQLSETEIETIKRWIAEGVEADLKKSAKATNAVSQHDVIPIMLRRCTACHGLHQKEAGLAAANPGQRSFPVSQPRV
jgi:mono/diheme cytochrome c family protein